ncbi:MAG TPA: type I 3-dehydroquinate dehydratase [Chthoniobacterales bacterium]|nr:type I 3-dehydroquinate dehydratase [Chthoniobacterales bacterium]
MASHLTTPPDLFELRLDHLIGLLDELEKKAPILRVPLIITARHPDEGGANQLSIQRRRELLLRFLPHARYVDVELRSVRELRSVLELARRKKVHRIISFHELKETPSARSLKAKARAAIAADANSLKIATRTDTPAQLVRLLEFFVNEDVDLPISAMGIGQLGAASRVVLAQLGSAFTYASIGRPTIEGQLSIRQLRSAFTALKIA